MSGRVGVLSYGAGNIGSIINMIQYVGGDPVVVSDIANLHRVSRVILPGVGHFDNGVQHLKKRGLFEGLKDWVDRERPLLGVCLGMQLLFSGSEEGCENGLDIVPGRVVRLSSSSNCLKIPHMGWNSVSAVNSTSALSHQLEGSRYYFMHSFHSVPDDRTHSLGITNYGEPFCSAVDNGRGVIGYQFHPEKSHRYGMLLIESFMEM